MVCVEVVEADVEVDGVCHGVGHPQREGAGLGGAVVVQGAEVDEEVAAQEEDDAARAEAVDHEQEDEEEDERHVGLEDLVREDESHEGVFPLHCKFEFELLERFREEIGLL